MGMWTVTTVQSHCTHVQNIFLSFVSSVLWGCDLLGSTQTLLTLCSILSMNRRDSPHPPHLTPHYPRSCSVSIVTLLVVVAVLLLMKPSRDAVQHPSQERSAGFCLAQGRILLRADGSLR